MGFRSSRQGHDSDATDKAGGISLAVKNQAQNQSEASSEWSRNVPLEEAESHFGMEVSDQDTALQLQRLEAMNTTELVRGWVDEGMTTDTMGDPLAMEAFRERQESRPSDVPTNVERRNKRSVQRSENAAADTSRPGETGVPDSVRDVISSPGQSLDSSIQRTMEERMGDSLGDVTIHTGPKAAKACEDINARAFTVGNHIAFNRGEYDPSSAEGQHVLAHELAHVRQQTGGAVSMLPQAGTLEIDPDPSLEREAEQTAQRVMEGGKLGIQRMGNSEVHIQRAPKNKDALETLAMLEIENETENHSDFRETQNDNRISHLRKVISEVYRDAEKITGDEDMVGMKKKLRLKELNERLDDELDDVGLTDDQRGKTKRGIDTSAWLDLGTPATATLIGALVDPLAGLAVGIGKAALANWFGSLDGDIEERMAKLTTELEEQGHLTGEGDSTGDARSRGE